MTWSEAQLDALEQPARRKRVTIGSAKDDTGASERMIQRAIIRAGARLSIRCVAVPNGVRLGGDPVARMKQMAALKADGLVVGWPDLICVTKGGRTGFLEVKRPGQALRREQEATMKALELLGHNVGAAASVDDALAVWGVWGWTV